MKGYKIVYYPKIDTILRTQDGFKASVPRERSYFL